MTPPPNSSLAELAAVVGEDNVRSLVRTFLRDFPASLGELTGGERTDRHRVVHNMKGSSRVVGAHDLSQRLGEIEERLADATAADLAPEEIGQLTTAFETIAHTLKAFVGPQL